MIKIVKYKFILYYYIFIKKIKIKIIKNLIHFLKFIIELKNNNNRLKLLEYKYLLFHI